MMLPSGNDAAFALAEFFGELLKMKKYVGSQGEAMAGNYHLSNFSTH